MYKDLDFAYEAIGFLEAEIGLPIDFQSQRMPYDVILQIKGETLYGLAQKNAKNFNSGILTDKVLELQKPNAILIADHLTPKTSAQLKANGINYMDASGNAFIRLEDFYIYITGKKVKSKAGKNEPRAFQEAGLKLILTLISKPETLQYSYRELSEYAQVSLGAITPVFNELEQNNFLLKTKDRRVLKNMDRLIEQWVIGYSNILKPKYFRKSFRTKLDQKEFENWLTQRYYDLKVYFGGEWAGGHLSKYLLSSNLSLFSNEEPARIVQEFNLIPDPEGNITLYGKFWSDKLMENDNYLAPKLVVYAQLMDSGQERNIETAKMILKDGL